MLIKLERGFGVLSKKVHFGHRLQHEVAVLALLERQLVLAQRFDEVTLLPECETEVVAGEPPFAGDLHLAAAPLLAGGHRFLVTLGTPLLEGEVRLRAR